MPEYRVTVTDTITGKRGVEYVRSFDAVWNIFETFARCPYITIALHAVRQTEGTAQ